MSLELTMRRTELKIKGRVYQVDSKTGAQRGCFEILKIEQEKLLLKDIMEFASWSDWVNRGEIKMTGPSIKLVILKCNSCEESDEYAPKETEQSCSHCKSSEDGFTELIECENCGEFVEDQEIIEGSYPDNSGACQKCHSPKATRAEYLEDKADYDYQCRKDERAEKRLS